MIIYYVLNFKNDYYPASSIKPVIVFLTSAYLSKENCNASSKYNGSNCGSLLIKISWTLHKFVTFISSPGFKEASFNHSTIWKI